MSTETEPQAAPAAPAQSSKRRAYARLAKLDIWDYYLGLLVVLALVPASERLDVAVLGTLAIFVVSELLVVAATVAFDDVTGYRDGSDARNYGPDAPARKLARKPLLTGALSVGEALRFGRIATAGAIVTTAAAIAVAPHRPLWAVLLVIVSGAAFIQYSYGAKLSYHGWGEVVLAGVAFGWLLGPWGLVSGTAGGFVVVQALIFGLGPLLFGVYSNTNDIEGDRSVNRRTVAATCSPRVNRIFIASVSAAETVLIVGSALVGIAPWWFPLAMAPVIALRAHQFDVGMRRGDILAARRLGIKTHRLAVVVLVVVNVVHQAVA